MWPALLAFTPALAALELWAEARRRNEHIFVLKPLTTASLVVAAALAPLPVSSLYRALVVAGLLCSLAGDVFLMLPRDRFLPGLTSFLLAHLCYIAAFSSAGGWPRDPLVALVLVLYGVALLRRLWPRLGHYRAPVALYAIVLLLMVAAAHRQFASAPDARAAAAVVGAVLFAASDSLLALDRFLVGTKRHQLIVLGTYFAAQWLIAASVAASPFH